MPCLAMTCKRLRRSMRGLRLVARPASMYMSPTAAAFRSDRATSSACITLEHTAASAFSSRSTRPLSRRTHRFSWRVWLDRHGGGDILGLGIRFSSSDTRIGSENSHRSRGVAETAETTTSMQSNAQILRILLHTSTIHMFRLKLVYQSNMYTS